MQFSRRGGVFALALLPSLAFLTGCEELQEHLELGKIEMRFEHFDRATGKLESLTPPETSRLGPSVVNVQEKLYYFGGLNTVPDFAHEVDVYDPVAKTFSAGAPWEDDQVFSSYFAWGDNMCIHTTIEAKSRLDCYDTKADAWRVLPEVPNGASLALGTLGDDLYAIGDAQNDQNPGVDAFRFDAAGNAWVSVSAYPGNCRPDYLGSVGTTLYAMPCDAQAPLYGYDPAADAW